ncbi:MAG: hypothetical protein IT463_06975 [Planctomycetes bacterium]|nr:hypothetical protein [Planctomycetota bacterium]
MQTIAVKDAKPGMVLARPVEDALGRVMINAGEKLTEDLIRVLIRRGYAEIEIRPLATQRVGLAGAAGNEDQQAAMAKLMAEFRVRFEGGAAQSTAHKSLMRVTLKVLVEQLGVKLKPAG